MSKRRSDSPEMGKKFGKPDLERIGLFSEMAYLSAKTKPVKKPPAVLRNLYCGGKTIKDATQRGYFDPLFKRIFSKEALKGRGRKPLKSKFKNVSKQPFLPPIGFKLHSSPGDYYGTFSGVIEAFSNRRRPRPPFKHEKKQILCGAEKFGGPGYADICLSRYPAHLPDRYGLKYKYKEYGQVVNGPLIPVHYPQPFFEKNPFKDPEKMKKGPIYIRPKVVYPDVIPPGFILPPGRGKMQGGCHDGCFEKFTYKCDRYGRKPKRVSEPVFLTLPRDIKSYYTTSVVHHNVDQRLNATNYLNFQPTFNKYIVTNGLKNCDVS